MKEKSSKQLQNILNQKKNKLARLKDLIRIEKKAILEIKKTIQKAKQDKSKKQLKQKKVVSGKLKKDKPANKKKTQIKMKQSIIKEDSRKCQCCGEGGSLRHFDRYGCDEYLCSDCYTDYLRCMDN